MIKIIFNNETEHIIAASELNISTTMKIDNFSDHNEVISIRADISCISLLQEFENTAISNIKVLNTEDVEIMTLTFTDGLYITNFNSNIYESNTNLFINLAKIVINRPEEEKN